MEFKKGSSKRSLLSRWLSGWITAREERELDRLAQDDPFLTEALEGYRQNPEADHGKKLVELRSRFEKRGSQRRFIAMRIAAATVFLVVAGVAMWRLSGTGGQDLAQMEPAAQEAMPAPDPATTKMSPREDNAKTAEEAPPSTGRIGPPEPTPRQPQLAPSTSGPPPADPVTNDQVASDIQTLEKEGTNVIAPPQPSESEQVARSPQLLPAPSAYEAVPAPPKALAKNTERDSTLIGGAAPIDLSGVALSPEAEEDSNRILVMKERAAANSTLRMQQEARRALAPPAAYYNKSALNPIAPQPAIDSSAYRQYVRTNQQYPGAAREAGISGAVTVQFSIDEKGKPNDFRIIQSLGYGCDEEAIRLIREGPMWVAPAGSITRYTIRFER